ncbi:MAG: oxidoreductase [Vicingaceae bacterium]|nr:MAG: oxidoreductase [Vicingaceae bacterium]GIV40695.1 MAG: oxidoreductase [Vicingaceae bacterium]
MHDFFEQIIRDLADKGFCISSFPDTDLCNDLKNEALLRYDEGSFHLASIGKSFRNTTDLSVRSDKIIWIEQNAQKFSSALRYLHFLNEFAVYLNRTCFTNIGVIECFYACYAPGSFYKKHLDRFKNSDNRLFTVILYLNDHILSCNQGGQLRLYTNDTNHLDIIPSLGTWVIFDSGRFYHEVLTSNTHRFSITAFMRRNNPMSF